MIPSSYILFPYEWPRLKFLGSGVSSCAHRQLHLGDGGDGDCQGRSGRSDCQAQRAGSESTRFCVLTKNLNDWFANAGAKHAGPAVGRAHTGLRG